MKSNRYEISWVNAMILAIASVFASCDTKTSRQHSSGENQTLVKLTRYEVKAEQQTVLRKAISNYVLSSLNLEDNILSEGYFEQEDSTVLWIIERWSSRTALEKSGKSRAAKDLLALAGNALIQPAITTYAKDLEPLSKEQWRNTAYIEDKAITIMLFVDGKTGTAERFKTVYHTAMPQFRSEAGVINYQLSQLEEDTTQFVTYEKFRDETAFQYHLQFPPIQPVLDYLGTSIEEQPFQKGLHRLIKFTL